MTHRVRCLAYDDCICDVLGELDSARAEVTRLRAALRRYGRHRRDCAALIEPRDEDGMLDRDRLHPCSCGFDAACAEEPGR